MLAPTTAFPCRAARERSVFNVIIGLDAPPWNREPRVHCDMLPTILARR